ncbi:MAG: sugar ABC transporter permease [Nocardioidaceae bacterium]|nr:sugar ABC transporter permease [Nocardioidaceae bacterium]
MTTTDQPAEQTAVATDLQDERLRRSSGLRGTVDAQVRRIKDGDLGVLPVVAGLVVIWGVLQALNPIFLSSANLVNLTLECASVGIIALGVVFMLLVGQIDLSVGSVSGLSSAIVAILFVDKGLPVVVAIVAAVLAGAVVGFAYSLMFNRFGVPSFVITLAGLLGFLGLQLYLLGAQGSINLPFDSGLVKFAQLWFVPPWLSYVLVVLAAGGLLVTGLAHSRKRAAAGLSHRGLTDLGVRSAVLLLLLGFVVFYLNQTRGVGWMFVLFVGLVLVMHYLLSRTKWGRSVYAVGGNVEAARRAGINVRLVYTSCFMLCTSFAALGGVLAAARLAAANQSSGGGDVNLNAIAAAVIGGTSLFGGRGTAFAALLGVLVIQSISSGLTLLSLDSSFRFMVTGAVLMLAVALDSAARRTRASSGRA